MNILVLCSEALHTTSIPTAIRQTFTEPHRFNGTMALCFFIPFFIYSESHLAVENKHAPRLCLLLSLPQGYDSIEYDPDR